jgi:hypothetical protein
MLVLTTPTGSAEAIVNAKVLLALGSRCLVLMYKVAIDHPSTSCYVIRGPPFRH